MKYLEKYKDFSLLESRKKDMENKYIKDLGINLGTELFDIDSTKNKAYSEWLLKFYKNNKKEIKKETNDKIEILSKMIKKYDKNKKDLSTPINKIKSLKVFRKVLDEKDNYDELEKTFTNKEIKIWYNSLEWIVFQPYTFEAAEYAYSKNRKNNWCTTHRQQEFDNHLGEKGGILYCVNKLDSNLDVAFELKLNETDITGWDYQDNQFDVGSPYIMKDSFETDSSIYNIFDDEIEHEIKYPLISRSELEENTRYFYEDYEDFIEPKDILDYLDESNFVNDFVEIEINYYRRNIEDLISGYEYEEILEWLKNNVGVEKLLKFYECDENNLEERVVEYDYDSLTKFINNNNLEFDISDKLTKDRYSGLDSRGLINDFYGDPDKLSVDDLKEYYGYFFDFNQIKEKTIDRIIKNSSDQELIELF